MSKVKTRKGSKGRSKGGAFTVGKGWRKTIGKQLAPDGRLMPRRFWLGMDEQRAASAALQIESLWLQQSAAFWSAEALKGAETIRVGLTRSDATEATPIAPIIKAKPLTFRQGIEKYRAAKLADPRLSEPSKHSIRCRTKTLERSPLCYSALAHIGAEQLGALVCHWLECPPAPKTDAPISEYSARMVVSTARSVFDWLDGVGLWEAPRRFNCIFKLPRSTSAPIIKTMTLDDLCKLYKAADGRMRLVILLALNCGFCSMECASLKRSEIDLDQKVIRRARQKTAIEMQWNLWDETATLLRAHLAPRNDADLALLTDGGKPMVWYSPNGNRCDALGQCWERLARRAKVAKPFKLLRKTGATMVRAIGGIEVSEQYLAHSEKSMARFYSTAAPERLTAALATLRQQLQPMFDAAEVAKPKGSKAHCGAL